MNNVSLTSDNLSQTSLSSSTPVSVIMPVRNEERHLADAVRHVLVRARARVTYRPRGSVPALALQYFNYGRWRRVVSRKHAGTVNLRYLAPPVAVLAMAAGLAGAWPGWPWRSPGRPAPRRTGSRGWPG